MTNSNTNYHPPQQILDKYAKVLIRYALNSGKGVKPKEVVMLNVNESAKPLLIALYKETLAAGAYPIIMYSPDSMGRLLFDHGVEDQVKFFPDKFYKGLVDQIDHQVVVRAEVDKKELVGIEPTRLMARQMAFKPYMEWRNKKEDLGKFTWTLGSYATESVAKEAGLTILQYWDEIIKACYLDEEDPVKKWKELQAMQDEIKKKLDALPIEMLNIKSARTDLDVQIGPNRSWMGGSGRNIPSFEFFISPDWRGTYGHIQFTEPLYVYGNLVKDAYLRFENGIVVESKASEGESVLKEMIKQNNADKIGEFSLTDSRMSRITKFMADTLYDENVGGKNGNTHIALGNAYTDSYSGEIAKVTKEQWEEWGYNTSAVHTDIVSTENRVITATLKDGSQKVIYKDGMFTI
jgi:aminopeptidase